MRGRCSMMDEACVVPPAFGAIAASLCASPNRESPMRKSCTAVALTLLLSACGDAPGDTFAQSAPASATPPAATPVPGAAAAPEASPAGEYAMTGARVGTLVLRDGGTVDWTIRLQGGGAPADGAGIAGDCEVHARGTLEGDRIEGQVVPFESALMSVTAADLERQPATVTVTFDAAAAVVETDFALCAMQADLNGRYLRQSAP